MGRPETISCERCGTTVAVKAKGPVPAYCADCRRRRTRPSRPQSVDCERCGTEVRVGARGPIPRYCREGCRDGNGRASVQPVRITLPTATRTGTIPAAVNIAPAQASSPPLAPAVVATVPVESPAPFVATTVTQMSTIDPNSVLDRRELGRTHRRRRRRQQAAIAAWLILVLVVLLILFVGSRPAPTNFQSYALLLA